MSKKLHWLVILFLIAAPLSVAGNFGLADAFKWVRLICTVIVVGVGLNTIIERAGLATKGMSVFVAFYVLSSLWSDSPHWALFYKGMFALTFFTGISLASSVEKPGEFESRFRGICLVAAAAGMLVFGMYLREPNEALRMGRMSVLGINPNALGSMSGALLLLTSHILFHEQDRRVRCVALVPALMLTFVILGTGSRAAVLMVVVGTICILLPYVRRPGLLVTFAVAAGTLLFLAIEVIEFAGATRLVSEGVANNRAGIWRFAMKKFWQSPLIGQGWLHYGRSTLNVQSSYLQVLAEAGVLGASLLFFGIAAVLLQGWTRLKAAMGQPIPDSLTFLALGLVSATLIHAAFESATFSGPSPNALLLGMGVGLLDCIPRFTKLRTPSTQRYNVWRVIPADIRAGA